MGGKILAGKFSNVAKNFWSFAIDVDSPPRSDRRSSKSSKESVDEDFETAVTFYFFQGESNSVFRDSYGSQSFHQDDFGLSQHKKTWWQAILFCQDLNMNLAKFETVEEFRAVEKIYSETFTPKTGHSWDFKSWVNLRDDFSGSFYWTAGKKYPEEDNEAWYWEPYGKTLPIDNRLEVWKERLQSALKNSFLNKPKIQQVKRKTRFLKFQSQFFYG